MRLAEGQAVPVPPTPPTPPIPVAPQIVVGGQPVTSPASAYQAFVAQRRELTRQVSSLEEQRSAISRRLRQENVTGADRTGLEDRLRQVDEQIAKVSTDLEVANANVARAAGVPGAIVQPPPAPTRNDIPEEAFVLGIMFMLCAILPLSIGFARRLVRGGKRLDAGANAEISERFTRLEQAVDAVAIEVERIGEGQRYITNRLGAGGGGGAEPIKLPVGEMVRR